MNSEPPVKIAIVGGGLAGLASAVALCQSEEANQRSVEISIYESRPRLGGRATSITDKKTGELIDNCQHVSMMCCTNFQHLCDTANLSNCFTTEDVLTFIRLNQQASTMRASSWLPAPLHLASSLPKIPYLSLKSKAAILFGLRKLIQQGPHFSKLEPNASFLDWLQKHNQPEEAIIRFWEIVLVSALSETLDRIDPKYAYKVFFDGFFRHRDSWRVQIPKVSLEELYGNRLRGWLEQQGVKFFLKTGVEQIQTQAASDRANLLGKISVTNIRLRNQEVVPVDHVVLAVPFSTVKTLLPNSVCDHAMYAGLEKIEAAPITSVHLWFDRPITQLRHAVLVDKMSQWVFNRTAIMGEGLANENSVNESSNDKTRYAYQVVISASQNLKSLSKEEIQRRVVMELKICFPDAVDAQLLHGRVITEHKAVFSVTPGIDALRPVQQSPIENLQVAGDWTATGWPATMEGAVKSGYLAAENILNHISTNTTANTAVNTDSRKKNRCVQPDLPTAWITRLLFWK